MLPAEVVSGHFTALSKAMVLYQLKKIDIACELCGNVKKGITEIYTIINEAGLA